jgi:hypothetical protein
MVMPRWKNLLPAALLQQNKVIEGKLCTRAPIFAGACGHFVRRRPGLVQGLQQRCQNQSQELLLGHDKY